MNDQKLATILRELEAFGAEHDARAVTRQEKMRNITPDTGEFLALLIRATRAVRVLEVGTSNGYSTLWLADAVRSNGGVRMTTMEAHEQRAQMARGNFARAGLAHLIDLCVGDAGALLAARDTESCDFVFLDAERGKYVGWWPDLYRILAPRGLIAVDNAVSHPEEVREFVQLVRQAPDCQSVLVPIGKGEFLVFKN